MDAKVYECIKEVFETNTPFSNNLGIKVLLDESLNPYIRLEKQEHLIGNYMQNILHGGVISSVLDIIGAIVAVDGVINRMKDEPKAEIMKKFEKLGTIDMRVDYLRPGRGDYFIATGEAMRTGNKVSVVRTKLKNNENILIAAGTGTYMVG
ncbi:thioesterase family protein [Seleniivibrio sp.]|uniref:thioesterase family protein n=1 Tax=Seleniivibrio sp. TaxID=2898801 RepID=UPI0025DEC6A7|nr:thioesterase family protein [Seleniivibrio sp.]MCD8553277.1 thioesterase family protein [Seleniivibrio sp.]